LTLLYFTSKDLLNVFGRGIQGLNSFAP
jgi:hypothetical protein